MLAFNVAGYEKCESNNKSSLLNNFSTFSSSFSSTLRIFFFGKNIGTIYINLDLFFQNVYAKKFSALFALVAFFLQFLSSSLKRKADTTVLMKGELQLRWKVISDIIIMMITFAFLV